MGLMFILTLVSVGVGFKGVVMEDVEKSLSLRNIVVWPAEYEKDNNFNLKLINKRSGFSSDSGAQFKKITKEDIRKMGNMSGVDDLLIWLSSYGSKLSIGDKVYRGYVKGIDQDFLEKPEVIRFKSGQQAWVEEGRFIEADDTATGVVTINLLEKLGFDNYQEIIGEKLEITCENRSNSRYHNFDPATYQAEIVGVIDDEKYRDIPRYSVIVPMGLAGKVAGYYQNNPYYLETRGPDQVQLYATSIDQVSAVNSKIKEMGYKSMANKSQVELTNNIFGAIKNIFILVGSIVFLISLVSIINTMTMATFERVKSIGIMKTVGASSKIIRKIFILEGALMGFCGWLGALIISYLNVSLANVIIKDMLRGYGLVTEQNIRLSIPLAVILLGITLVTTGLSALFPANRAARLEIIDSLASK